MFVTDHPIDPMDSSFTILFTISTFLAVNLVGKILALNMSFVLGFEMLNGFCNIQDSSLCLALQGFKGQQKSKHLSIVSLFLQFNDVPKYCTRIKYALNKENFFNDFVIILILLRIKFEKKTKITVDLMTFLRNMLEIKIGLSLIFYSVLKNKLLASRVKIYSIK